MLNLLYVLKILDRFIVTTKLKTNISIIVNGISSVVYECACGIYGGERALANYRAGGEGKQETIGTALIV